MLPLKQILQSNSETTYSGHKGWGFPILFLYLRNMQEVAEDIHMKKLKNKKGFTLAELLVVVAIVGILVAISIPVFAAQKKKAVIATNKANIRSAKAVAMAEIYGGDAESAFVTDKNEPVYVIYDVKTDKIKEIKKGNGAGNSAGTAAYEQAKNGEVCDTIVVYIGPNDDKKGNMMQTAPYYNDDDTLGLNGSNPFGPGSGTGSVSGGVTN